MRILSLIVTLPFSLFVIWFAVSNRADVTVTLDYIDLSMTAPLFVFIGASFVIGFFVGAILIQLRRIKDKLELHSLNKSNARLLKDIAGLNEAKEKAAREMDEKNNGAKEEKSYFFNKASDIIPFRRNITGKDNS